MASGTGRIADVHRRGRDHGSPAGDQVAHFLTPVDRIWPDAAHARENQRIFCSEDCVEPWTTRTAHSRGAVMTLTTLWRLAEHWYEGRLTSPHTRRDPAAAAPYVESVGLRGPFWGSSSLTRHDSSDSAGSLVPGGRRSTYGRRRTDVPVAAVAAWPAAPRTRHPGSAADGDNGAATDLPSQDSRCGVERDEVQLRSPGRPRPLPQRQRRVHRAGSCQGDRRRMNRRTVVGTSPPCAGPHATVGESVTPRGTSRRRGRTSPSTGRCRRARSWGR